jgi:hypothetical protein
VTATTVHFVCSNCGGGSDTAALAAAIAAGVTALITLGVAIATFKTADATSAQVRLLDKSADEVRRPVLIPLVPMTGPLGPAGPTDSQGDVTIPLRNIGGGPALNISVVQTQSAGTELAHAQHHARHHAGCGVGDDIRTTVQSATVLTTAHFVIELQYEDLVGKPYVTTATWNPHIHEYDVKLASPDHRFASVRCASRLASETRSTDHSRRSPHQSQISGSRADRNVKS